MNAKAQSVSTENQHSHMTAQIEKKKREIAEKRGRDGALPEHEVPSYC